MPRARRGAIVSLHRGTRWLSVLLLTIAVVAWPQRLASQPPDAEIEKGIKQAQEGEYEAAIMTLDAAARRLGSDRARARELSQAHLHLGVAYLAQGHETLAKSQFKEALGRDPDLRLRPDAFAPRVLELFEKAREESAATARAREAPAKKGGSKKGLLLVGAGVLSAGAGVAVAVSGGEDTPPLRDLTFGPRTLSPIQTGDRHDFAAVGSGLLEATLTWNEPNAVITMDFFDAAIPRPDASGLFQNIARGTRTGTNSVQLSAHVTPKNYGIAVYRIAPDPQGSVTYTLMVRVP